MKVSTKDDGIKLTALFSPLQKKSVQSSHPTTSTVDEGIIQVPSIGPDEGSQLLRNLRNSHNCVVDGDESQAFIATPEEQARRWSQYSKAIMTPASLLLAVLLGMQVSRIQWERAYAQEVAKCNELTAAQQKLLSELHREKRILAPRAAQFGELGVVGSAALESASDIDGAVTNSWMAPAVLFLVLLCAVFVQKNLSKKATKPTNASG